MALEFVDHCPLRFDTSYSHTPRARAIETQTYSPDSPRDENIWNYLKDNGAATARYVVGINRTGATPSAPLRDPRAPFRDSGTLLGTRRLSKLPLSAQMHVIGGVTGPYVAGEGDWHGMLLVTRGKRHVPTFGELTKTEMHQLHHTISKTLTFLEEEHPQNTNIVGFSFSPYENRRVVPIDHPDLGRIDILHPRSPVQNLASIHGHAISMNEDNLHAHPTSSKPFDERLTREPFLPQLVQLMETLVLHPTFREFPDVSLQTFSHTEKDTVYPKGLFVSFSQDDFVSAKAARFIQRAHRRYEHIYWQIAHAVVDVSALKKGRVVMRPVNEARKRVGKLLEQPGFADLSSNTKRFIRMFAELQDPNDMIHPSMHPSRRAKIMEQFILLGPAYNVLYYRQAGRIIVGWHPRFITGASPIETAGVFKDQQPTASEDFLPLVEQHKAIGRRLLQRLQS